MIHHKIAAISVLFVAVVSASASASAQITPNTLAKCAQIENSLDRLTCFDSATQGLRSAKGSTKGSGRWKIERTVSKMDDSKTIVASVIADSDIRAWLGKVYRPVFVLRCMEGKQSAYFVVGTASAVESDPYYVTIKVRMDQQEAQEIRATESTDKEALFLIEPKRFFSELKDKSKLLLGFTPFNSSPVLASFDIRGVEPVVEEIKKECP